MTVQVARGGGSLADWEGALPCVGTRPQAKGAMGFCMKVWQTNRQLLQYENKYGYGVKGRAALRSGTAFESIPGLQPWPPGLGAHTHLPQGG